MGIFTGDGIGVDLGSSFVGIHLSGEGIALRESASVLSLKSDPQQVLGIGDEARQMLGRTAEDCALVSPVMDGAVTDVDVCALMVLALTERATGKRKPMEKVQLMMSMPVGLTKVERGALESVARLTGSKRTLFAKSPLAAALGAGLSVDEPRGTMVVVLGGGVTEICVLSMNGIVAARSMRTGSLSMDEAIQRYVRRHKDLIIGPRTAEDLKCDIGSAVLPAPTEAMDQNLIEGTLMDEDGNEIAKAEEQGEKVLLKGKHTVTGMPTTIEITTRDIALALQEPVAVLVDAMRDALSRTPEELASDILEQGIHLSGGGARLFGLAELLEKQTGVPVSASDHPEDDVLLGLGRLLDDERLCRACIEAGSVED